MSTDKLEALIMAKLVGEGLRDDCATGALAMVVAGALRSPAGIDALTGDETIREGIAKATTRLDSVDVVTPTLGLLLRVQDALGVLREAGWTVSVYRDLRGNERELVARYPLRESRDGN